MRSYQFEISDGRELLSGKGVRGPRDGIVVSTPSSDFPSNSPSHSFAKAVITNATSRIINSTVTILK